MTTRATSASSGRQQRFPFVITTGPAFDSDSKRFAKAYAQTWSQRLQAEGCRQERVLLEQHRPFCPVRDDSPPEAQARDPLLGEVDSSESYFAQPLHYPSSTKHDLYPVTARSSRSPHPSPRLSIKETFVFSSLVADSSRGCPNLVRNRNYVASILDSTGVFGPKCPQTDPIMITARLLLVYTHHNAVTKTIPRQELVALKLDLVKRTQASISSRRVINLSTIIGILVLSNCFIAIETLTTDGGNTRDVKPLLNQHSADNTASFADQVQSQARRTQMMLGWRAMAMLIDQMGGCTEHDTLSSWSYYCGVSHVASLPKLS